MEEQIKHVASRLKVIFISLWLLPVIWIIVGETGGDWVVTTEAIEMYDMPTGAFVRSVEDDSPAQEAGVCLKATSS